jgi:chitinase domain-containing protein 1
MNLLADNDPEMIWNERTAELEMRFTIDGKQSAVFFPTDLSIQMRVDLAERLGVGISIWELGQGLPYLYQAL